LTFSSRKSETLRAASFTNKSHATFRDDEDSAIDDTSLRSARRRNILRLTTLAIGAIAHSVFYGLAQAFFSSSMAPKNSGDLLAVGS